jgi:hypothetical protein
MNMKDVLRGTAANDTQFFGGSDPTILIRAGYAMDSRLAHIKLLPSKPAPEPSYFINTRPEGTRNR